MKGFVIAGTKDGVGKTIISLGLMKALEDVTPFKIGPDYIDGILHEKAVGNKSYNLDYFLMKKEGLKYSLLKNIKSIGIIDSCMGMYDGLGDELDNGSTAHIARILKLPVILVVNGEDRGISLGAEVLGYKLLDERINIIGVIINNVSSKKSYENTKKIIEKYGRLSCFGYLKKNEEIALEKEWFQSDEVNSLDKKLEILGEEIKKTVDIQRILELSNIEIDLDDDIGGKLIRKEILLDEKILKLEKILLKEKIRKDKYRKLVVGVAKDKAFPFYYNDNLDFFKVLGIEIKYFSPIYDKEIPEDVDLLYFGGGCIEKYSKELTQNVRIKESIKTFYANGGIIYGECGGYIYLSSGLTTLNGEKYKFLGITPIFFQMKDKVNIKKSRYINVNFTCGEKNEEENFKFPAHEFYYSEAIEVKREEENIKDSQLVMYGVSKDEGKEWEDGYTSKNLLCGYPHLHFFTSQELIYNLLDRALEYREERNRFKLKDLINLNFDKLLPKKKKK